MSSPIETRRPQGSTSRRALVAGGLLAVLATIVVVSWMRGAQDGDVPPNSAQQALDDGSRGSPREDVAASDPAARHASDGPRPLTPPATLAVDVRDAATSAGIPGADVWLASDTEDDLVHARTDSAGRAAWDVDPSTLGDTRVLARASGYQPASRALSADAGPSQPTQMLLERASTVSGRVVWKDGTPAPPGTMVCAYPDGRPPRPWDSPGDAALLLRAETDAAGAYVLDGIEPSATVTVVTAGPGLIGGSVRRGVAAGATDVVLTVLQRLAVAVTFVDADDGRPLNLQAHAMPASLTWTTDDASITRRRLSPLSAWLMGPDSQDASAPTAPWDVSRPLVIEYARESPASTPGGPLALILRIPGYERLDARLDVPVVHGELEPMQFAVHRDPDAETGEIHAAILGLARMSGGASAAPAICDLVLASVTGTYRLSVLDGSSETSVFSGVPAGDYHAQLAFPGSVRPLLPRHPDDGVLRVRSGVPVFVEFDVYDAGAVNNLLLTASGEMYEDTAVFRVASATTGAAAFTSFRGPPYILLGLPEGEHIVTVDGPLSGSPQPVRIVAGAVASAVHVVAP